MKFDRHMCVEQMWNQVTRILWMFSPKRRIKIMGIDVAKWFSLFAERASFHAIFTQSGSIFRHFSMVPIWIVVFIDSLREIWQSGKIARKFWQKAPWEMEKKIGLWAAVKCTLVIFIFHFSKFFIFISLYKNTSCYMYRPHDPSEHKLRPCNGCHHIYYCGKECQVWNIGRGTRWMGTQAELQ